MTGIEWVLNPDGTRGITVNSKTGCLNHTPEGLCLGGLFPCYAYKLAHGRLRQRYLVNKDFAYLSEDTGFSYAGKRPELPFYPRFWPERLDKIRATKKPTGIFLDDMSDWMGDYWPEEWTRQELQVMRDCPQHRFYTLTKQPQNLIKFSPFPENCWVGVTICDADMYLPAMEALDKIDAKVRYISFEPLLENPSEFCEGWFEDLNVTLDWLIIGACTGRERDMWILREKYPDLTVMLWGNKFVAEPKIEWLKQIVEATDKAGLPVFLKDNLDPLLRTVDGQIPTGLCDNYGHTLRQEMPNV